MVKKIDSIRGLVYGFIIGLLVGAGLTVIISLIIMNNLTVMEKTQAVVGCLDHKGVVDTKYRSITCKDGYRIKSNYEGVEVSFIYKLIDDKTIFGITFFDWKDTIRGHNAN